MYKRYQYVNCYYCGRFVRLDKAIILTVSPRLKPEVPENQAPLAIIAAPRKIYVCPACARFRGLTRKVIKEKGTELFKRLGIEI